MQGVVIVGTGELDAAAAVCEALGSAHAFVAAATGPGAKQKVAPLAEASERVFETAASPLVAARHVGVELRRDALLEAAAAAGEGGGEPVVVVTSGGLLAPLAERYSNRDFARELGLPVVIATEPSPDMLAGTLLAIEGARGAGLAVPAVIIANWPETPNRVLLDERQLLEDLARTPVFTAIDATTVATWFEATASPQATAEARVTLEPYDAWEAQPTGDPRATPRQQIMQTMLEIVGAEGPMTASRAYALYNRASGGKKLTTVARAPLSSSVYWLAQERKVVLVRKEEIPWQDDDVVRMPDSPAVRVRELGPRSLEEVPLDEIAELIRRLRASRGNLDATATKRAVLDAYGLVRLTSKADEYLGLALDLADGD
jgi:dethiobiotin synthetase